MADASTVSVLIQAKDQASAQFQKIEGNMGKMAAGFAKHRRAIGLAATAIGGAITGIAAMSVKSSFDQQQGIRSLDQALKNVGTSYAAQKQQIESLASAQQLKTNFGDEEQRKALQKLVQVSGSYDDAMAAMIPTMDLAAATEMDLGAAATLVARAISGEETALGRYGVEVEKGAGSTAVLTKIMEQFGGQAEANADPMIQLKNRVGDLFQVLGDDLLPILENLLPKIEAATRSIIEWTEAHPTLTKVLGLAAVAIGGILLVLGPLLLLLPTMVTAIGLVSLAFVKLNLSMGVVSLVIIGIAVAIAAGILIWKNWDKIVGFVKKTIAEFTKIVLGMARQLLQTFKAMIDWIPGMGKVRDALTKQINKLGDMEQAMGMWAEKGQRSFSDVGSAASDSEREIAMAAQLAQEDMQGMGQASDEMTSAIKTSTDKVQTSFKETTEVVTASTRGWGFEIDKATGITEEMAVRTATATRNIADAFQEAGDVVVTQSQRKAQAVRDAEAEIQKALEKRTSALTVNAAIDRFLSNQLIENMEGVLNARVTLTDRQISEIERGNRETARLVAEREKIEKESLDRQVAEYEKSFKAQEAIRLARGEATAAAAAEGAARTQKQQTPQYRNMKAQQDALAKAEESLRAAEQRITNQKERLVKIRAESPVGNTAGTEANQRRIDYWHANTRPNMDALRDLGDARNRARENVERLQNNIAANVIPEVIRTGYEIWFREQEATWSKEKAKIGAFQGGGISGGGLALVGERGPEIVSLPGGSRVHPSGTGPGSNQFHFHGAVYGLEDLRRVVVEAVRDHALSGGFRGVFGEA
jgi:hypothetical protein